VSELEKLSLYRLDGQIVPRTSRLSSPTPFPARPGPSSTPVGMRHAAQAAELADRLDDVPSPVLVVHLHRRLRELIQIADLLAAARPRLRW